MALIPAGVVPQSAAAQASRCALAAWASLASQAVRNAARSFEGPGVPRSREGHPAGMSGSGEARDLRDQSHAPNVASHTAARPMLIHSHCEGERSGASRDDAVAGTAGRNAFGVARDCTAGEAGAGGREAAATVS